MRCTIRRAFVDLIFKFKRIVRIKLQRNHTTSRTSNPDGVGLVIEFPLFCHPPGDIKRHKQKRCTPGRIPGHVVPSSLLFVGNKWTSGWQIFRALTSKKLQGRYKHPTIDALRVNYTQKNFLERAGRLENNLRIMITVEQYLHLTLTT